MVKSSDETGSVVQAARRFYFTRDALLNSVGKQKPKPGKGGRKTGHTGYGRAELRKKMIRSGELCEYDSYVVMRRTVLDRNRTPAMIANELRFWDTLAARHELGMEGYRAYLTEQIDCLEKEACCGLRRRSCSPDDQESSGDDDTRSFFALRRLVAILAQERTMLDMSEPQLKAIGFDGAFIALGRCIVKAAFRAEVGWYTERELSRRAPIDVGEDGNADSNPD